MRVVFRFLGHQVYAHANRIEHGFGIYLCISRLRDVKARFARTLSIKSENLKADVQARYDKIPGFLPDRIERAEKRRRAWVQ